MMKLWLLSFFIATTFALPTTDELTENEQPSCDDVFTNNGMNFSSFPKGAGHGIHSLSLEEIRSFFKEDAPEDNGIPTVNLDLESNNILHVNAPLWGYEDRFDTWALKIMDWFMLNDKPQFIQGYRVNILENITHQYYMQEIYQRAAVIYKDLLTNPPKDVHGFCFCATDLTLNGVMEEVVTIARHIRQFGLWYGGGRGKRSVEDEYEYEYADEDERFQRDWGPHSAVMTDSLSNDDGIRDFAYFIYCMLNHPAKKQ